MCAPEGLLEVPAHVCVESIPAGLEVLEAGAQLGALRLRLRSRPRHRPVLFLELHAARIQLGEGALEAPVRAVQQLARSLEHVVTEPHARRHGGGGRHAGHSDPQPIRRRQRFGIEVEAGVLEARVDLRHLLQEPVVRRHDHARAGAGERLEDRLRQRRAFAGVGAVADLVEHHERVGIRRVDDPRQVGQVRGERGEILAQALGVADVGEQAFGPVDAGAGRRGDVQAGARAQRRERHRLHRDGLAACVRAREHEDADRVAEMQVVRHRLRRLEQRMPELRQREDALVAELRLDGVPLCGQRAARECQVDRFECCEARAQRGRLAPGAVGERAEHARRLALDP